MEVNKIYNENCLETMGRMPEGFVDCCVCSGFLFYHSIKFTSSNIIKII